ncbi:MAG: VanW family protein [Christensenellaceae bacterium]|jgi:vancomycin resistance protein YoaR
MKRYRTATARRHVNVKRLGVFIAVVAVIAALIIYFVYTNLNKKDGMDPVAEAATVEVTTIADGVTVGGVDVSGMTVEQGEAALSPVVEEMLAGQQVTFDVPDKRIVVQIGADGTELPRGGSDEQESSDSGEGEEEGEDAEEKEEITEIDRSGEPYVLDLATLGVTVDTRAPLEEALEYSRQQAVANEKQPDDGQEGEEGGENVQPATTQIDFPLEYTIDEAAIKTHFESLAELDAWGKKPVNANYKVEVQNDESGLTTWGSLVKSDPEDGYEVDIDSLTGMVAAQITSGQYEAIDAPTTVLPGSASGEAKEYVLMGTGTTTFEGSPENRRYNIWKISSQLNGAVLGSWDTFSVNDHVGPRNADTGYKEANGIEDGTYTPQYGGGICQVSSTMYNACLKAEMEIVSRVPHTIMAGYVKPGLDATISTGGPDFKVKNITDDPMFLIVKCNVPDRKVTVELWGTRQRDYEVELYSEALHEKDSQAPPPEFRVNAALDPYAINEVKPSRRYEKYQLYARKVDSNGNVIEDKIDVGTSTYRAITGIYEVGSAVPFSPGQTLAEVKAARDAAAGAAAPPADQVLDPGVEQEQPTQDPPADQPSEQPSEQPSTDPGTTPSADPGAVVQQEQAAGAT